MNCNKKKNNFYDSVNGHYNSMLVTLSQEECNAIREECTHYEDIRAASIEALKIVQKNRGWVSNDAIILIARILCVSVSDLEGVATFYNQIFRQPVGRHIIRYCDSIVCYLFNCEKIKEVLISLLGITTGNTTTDNRFTLLPTCCVGMCNKAPVFIIDDDIYHHVIPKKIATILERYL